MPGNSRARSSPAFDLGGGNGLQATVHGPLRSRVRPGVGPLAMSPVSTSTTTAPFMQAPLTTPPLPEWYAHAVRGKQDSAATSVSTAAQKEPANGVPSWAQDVLPDAGSASEEQQASRPQTQQPTLGPKDAAAAANAPAWMKESLDDPMMAGTIAAGRAEESPVASGDLLGGSTPKTAPRPAAAPAPSPGTTSMQQPTLAPSPEPPPSVPVWAKAGGNAAKGTESDTGKGDSKPPPLVPDWAKDYVAGS